MLPKALRLLRIFHDLKLKELAEQLEVSASYLSEIESGKKKPTLELVHKYAVLFHTTPSSILFFSEDLEKEPIREGFAPLLSKKTIAFLQKIEEAGQPNTASLQ